MITSLAPPGQRVPKRRRIIQMTLRQEELTGPTRGKQGRVGGEEWVLGSSWTSFHGQWKIIEEFEQRNDMTSVSYFNDCSSYCVENGLEVTRAGMGVGSLTNLLRDREVLAHGVLTGTSPSTIFLI